MSDAIEFLRRVEEEAKRLYALSEQGSWETLHPTLKAFWINAAGHELRQKEAEEQ